MNGSDPFNTLVPYAFDSFRRKRWIVWLNAASRIPLRSASLTQKSPFADAAAGV